MKRHSPEWIKAVLVELEDFCLAHSTPQSEKAIVCAIKKAKSESRSEMLEAAIALNLANAVNAADVA